MAKTKNPQLEERRKAQVIETVQRLMTESSYKTMTMDMVAREAGVSKGLINYYFKSKDDLIVQTIHAYHQREAEIMLSIVNDDSLAARERVKKLIATAFPSRKAVEDELRFQTEVRSYAKTNEDAWQAAGESYKGFRVALEQLLRKGMNDGYVTRDMDEEEVKWTYLFFHSMVNGLTFQVTLDKSIIIDDLRDRLLSHLDRMVTA